MVEKRTMRDICTGDDSLGTEFVLAADYAALEAERDEWKRERDKWYGRCDALMNWLMDKGDLHDEAVAHLNAIAEGRDNG